MHQYMIARCSSLHCSMADVGKQPARTPRTREQVVDEILKRVLRMAIGSPPDPPANAQSQGGKGAASGIVYLEQLAAELLSENKAMLLNCDVLERALMDRLSMGPEDAGAAGAQGAGGESPLEYAVGSYGRAVEEGRKVANMKDPEKLKMVLQALECAKDLLISYAGLSLQHPDMFPSPARPRSHGRSSPLTDFIAGEPPALLLAAAGGTGGVGVGVSVGEAPGSRLPVGFLGHLVQRFEGEELDAIMQPVFTDISSRVLPISLLGPFQGPLSALTWLLSFPALARCFVQHPSFNPATTVGRVLERSSLLGPFLHISIIPDPVLRNGVPDPSQQLFSKPSERRKAELSSSFVAVRSASRQLLAGLHEVLRVLLKAPLTRDKVLEYLAALIRTNANRAALQIDRANMASHGMFLNLGSLLLKLCEPFLDPSCSKADRIDPAFVLQSSGRLDFSKLTAIHATSDEVSSWVDQRNLARQQSFLQAQRHREQEELQRLQACAPGAGAAQGGFPGGGAAVAGPVQSGAGAGAGASAASPVKDRAAGAGAGSGSGGGNGGGVERFGFICECFFMTARVLNLGLLRVFQDLTHIQQRMGRDDREALRVLEAMRGPGEPADLEERIAQHQARVDQVKEYTLCYESALQDPEVLQEAVRFYHMMVVWLVRFVGGFHLPLPAPAPKDWASMPEHFVDDAIETLLLASRIPHALDGLRLDELMSFIVMFMGSPLYIKNPYLRAKMVKVLQHWMPSHSPTPTVAASMASLFEGHPLAMRHLAPNLIKLYVDVEFTGSHNAFYEKFNTRFEIADLLEYLWDVPSHRAAWIHMSVEECSGFYLRYVSLLINDSIYLLDEALEKIPRLKEEEAAMADKDQWLQLPAEERQTREQDYQRDQSIVRSDLQLANANVRMIQYSTTEIVKPFLLPEMVERVASMLNYFLLQLVGPKRKALRVTNPEKYEFHPKKLLSQIVNIYANLAKHDADHRFAEAVSADGRSYREEAFPEAASVIGMHGLLPGDVVQQFMELAAHAKAASAEAMDIETQLDDIPNEFLDPIQCTLMRDPVTLPSGNVVDRPVILRHLLSDPKDPFTRAHLTAEMLVPNTELKARIDAFLAQHKAKRQQ
ncbi:unnamed protein product [Closterium sp. Naga37s-1]|nr:unnamed protein product [Closterium sp. Naga37s-1]